MEVVVDVQNLEKKFDGITAVDSLSFTVNKGDIYGFLGQNGAGKSTTLRMLLGLITPSGGSINIFQHNISDKLAILRKTGALIERPDLYKYLTAYENMSMFTRLSGLRVNREKIMRQLETVGLQARYNSKIKTFSQGMKQRLGIAVALVHDPELLILDEPTNGLDPQGIADIRQLIKKLSSEQGKTIIISSHLLSEIEQMATRMLIIHQGRKVIEGKVSELLDPSDTIVKVEGSDTRLIGQILEKNGYRLLSADGIRVKMNKAEIPGLISMLTGEGVKLYGVQAQHTLEDYFISLTNPNR